MGEVILRVLGTVGRAHAAYQERRWADLLDHTEQLISQSLLLWRSITAAEDVVAPYVTPAEQRQAIDAALGRLRGMQNDLAKNYPPGLAIPAVLVQVIHVAVELAIQVLVASRG